MNHLHLLVLALTYGISSPALARTRADIDLVTLTSPVSFDRAVVKVNFIAKNGRPRVGYVEMSPIKGKSTANLFAATTNICKYVMTQKGYEVQAGSCGGQLLNKFEDDIDNLKAIQIAEIRVGKYKDNYFEQGASGTHHRPHGAFVHQRNTPFSMKGTTARKFRVVGQSIKIIGDQAQPRKLQPRDPVNFKDRMLRNRNPQKTK